MTGTDEKTGLPLVGALAENVNIVPIDPKLLPELREKLGRTGQIDEAAKEVGVAVIAALTQAVTLGLQARQVEHEANEFLDKLLRIHGVDPETVKGKPLAEWLSLEKGQIRVPRA